MRIRSFALLAAVAVPVAVTATHVHGRSTRPTAQFAVASGITSVGSTSLLRRRTRTASCTIGTLPDRRCSPGAFERRLDRETICADAFRTSDVRSVPGSKKHAVEIEYGLEPKRYGNTLEIDHIVSLELGGSNDIANLYPERSPGYRTKDKLENRLHSLVCAGKMSLLTAQRRIASNWELLYRKVFGIAP